MMLPMEIAPSIELEDLDGQRMDLDDLRGGPVILSFLRYVG